jgi:hypothetical protein
VYYDNTDNYVAYCDGFDNSVRVLNATVGESDPVWLGVPPKYYKKDLENV